MKRDELECGLLDWYNLSRAPAVSVWGGCLGGCEPEVLTAHGISIMEAFAGEYRKYGGPSVDAAELLRLYQLAFPASLAGTLSSSMADAMVAGGPSEEEWGAIESHWRATSTRSYLKAAVLHDGAASTISSSACLSNVVL